MSKYLLYILLLMGAVGQTWAQDQTMIQLKALDQQLQPYPRLKISINQGLPNKLDSQGLAFFDIESKELPPRSITVLDDQLEVESWNFSRGILEIVIRPKTYKKISIILRNDKSRPLQGIKVVFQAEEPVISTSNASGIVAMSVPIHEDLNKTNHFIVEGYQIIGKKFKNNQGYLKIVPLAAIAQSRPLIPATGNQKAAPKVKVIESFQEFNFDYLDSIESLTVFYAVIKNVDVENFNQELTQKIDAKFYELIGKWGDSLNSVKSENFLGKISDSSLVQNDINLLIGQAQQEKQTLSRIRNEFDANVQTLNSKLIGGGIELSEIETQDILKGIAQLNKILSENEELFYKNQAHFRDLLNTLSNKLKNIDDLEKRLVFSESERVRESKDFNQKLKTVVAISLALALFGMISMVLTKKFKKQKNQLAKANSEVTRINEHLEELIAKRTLQLQETNKELDTFLYKSSHNLRRPLTTIVGLANIARLTLKKEAYELFERAANTANQMDKMLKKLINVSEIHHPSRYRSIDFATQVGNIIDEFQDLIVDNNIDVESSVQPDIAFNSYPNLIEIIIKNLAENALWFSTLNDNNHLPKVNIKVTQENGLVSINFQDNGPGIEKNIHDKIWDMFFVGHEKSKGNGLGLYITGKAVKALHGDIQMKSQENGMTTFEVLLPVNGKTN